MGPFWIVAVRLYNFRSYPKAEIKFQRNGLTLIRGHNLDTGGSSYSGKTSITLAIAMALGYLPYAAKDQRSWSSEGLSAVELDIGFEHGQATIRAGDRPWLKLPDGRKITSAAAIREERDRLLGVTPEILAALTWQRQKKGSRFLSKTDAEKKEFLGNVMPWLTKIERAAEDSDVKIHDITVAMDTNKALLSHQEQTLRSLVISEPVLVDLPVVDNLIESLSEQGAALEARILAAKTHIAHAEEMSTDVPGLADMRRARNEAIDRAQKVQFSETDRIQKHNAQAAQLNQAVYQANSIVASIPRKKAKVKALEAGQCPTCNQPWYTEQELAEAIRDLDEALVVEQNLSGLILEQQRHVFKPDPMIAALAAAATNIGHECDRLQQEQNTKLAIRQAVKNDAFRELTIAEREYAALQQQGAEADHSVDLARQENEHRQADYDRAVARRNEVASQMDGFRVLIAKNEEMLHAEEDFQALIGRTGFLGSIFDEVLREISEETNKILVAVANTAHVTVNFLSEVSTLKGKINKTITPLVTISGNVADLESGASGGMETSIGLAVDLAVATVISRRTNTWPGWLILDESFAGLDQVSKETCMEILKQHACNRLVLVVDHASETKELFSNFVDVEFTNGVSRVVT